MILITGAAGKTGRAIIRALARRSAPVRAQVYRREQSRVARDLGAQNTIVGDMRQPETLARATKGVWAIYHICPNMSPDELSIGEVLIAAARAAGVQYLVYHSVLHPQTEAMAHHWQKLRVEERLFESGLAWTILQPAAYMQNVLAHWGEIVTEGVYPVPYPASTRLSMVDLEDVAEAAAKVLTEPGHLGATYELVGAEMLSQTEVAAVLSGELGRSVRAEPVSPADWERGARAAGLGDYQVTTLLSMFEYYGRHGFWGNAQVLGWLLGRPPTSFQAVVRRTVREYF